MDFIQDVRDALKSNQCARAFYFPPNKAKRHDMNLRLGREVDYSIKDASVLSSLYSLLIVSFSFDRTGVCVDNKEFLAAVREGMRKNSFVRKVKKKT